MNEVDDVSILSSSCPQVCYQESWKFAEVAFIIKFSTTSDCSYPFGEKLPEFLAYWKFFIPQFWFAARFLDNVFAGVSFAMDYLVMCFKSTNGTKKSCRENFGRAMAYLFTFEPYKCESVKNQVTNFFHSSESIKFCEDGWISTMKACINRILFDFTNTKKETLIQSIFVDDVELFDENFISKLATSCKQKLGYQLLLSSRARTRKLKGPAYALLLQYWNGLHWSFLLLSF
jgi:hypothetical protein